MYIKKKKRKKEAGLKSSSLFSPEVFPKRVGRCVATVSWVCVHRHIMF